jgi:uncharacterized protein (DUF885 family)
MGKATATLFAAEGANVICADISGKQDAFLQTEYLPKARVTPSIIRQPQGMARLRARLTSSTTVDMDPNAMFDVLVARRQAERARRVRKLENPGRVRGQPFSDGCSSNPSASKRH